MDGVYENLFHHINASKLVDKNIKKDVGLEFKKFFK